MVTVELNSTYPIEVCLDAGALRSICLTPGKHEYEDADVLRLIELKETMPHLAERMNKGVITVRGRPQGMVQAPQAKTPAPHPEIVPKGKIPASVLAARVTAE